MNEDKNTTTQQENLPLEIKRLYESDWATTVTEIGSKNSLSEDQISSFVTETGLAILGVASLDQYKQNLKTQLDITDEKAEELSVLAKPVFQGHEEDIKKNFNDSRDAWKIATNETAKAISELPQNIQTAINSIDWRSIVLEVGKKNNLSTEQLGSLQVETSLIFTEGIYIDEFKKSLEDNAHLPSDTAEKVAADIQHRIFDAITIPEDHSNETPAVSTPPTNLPVAEDAPSPTDILASIKSRLVTQATIAPASRELPPPKKQVPQDQTKEEKSDPYREPI